MGDHIRATGIRAGVLVLLGPYRDPTTQVLSGVLPDGNGSERTGSVGLGGVILYPRGKYTC